MLGVWGGLFVLFFRVEEGRERKDYKCESLKRSQTHTPPHPPPPPEAHVQFQDGALGVPQVSRGFPPQQKKMKKKKKLQRLQTRVNIVAQEKRKKKCFLESKSAE